MLLSVAGSGCGASGAVSPSGTAVGVVCIPVGCLSGAVYDGPLTVGNSDPQSLTITACRNGACPYTTLRFDPTQSRFVGRILGPLTVDISLDTSPVPARLFVHIAGRPELLIDGDLYELKVQNTAGASLLNNSCVSAFLLAAFSRRYVLLGVVAGWSVLISVRSCVPDNLSASAD